MSILRAIIVDDEADCISLVQSLLSTSGAAVEVLDTCQSVDEAVVKIEKYQPNLVFLDVEMPEKDGFQLLKHFKTPLFKVIFISSYGHYALRAIKFSAVDYILKPIDIDELVEATEKVRGLIDKEDHRINHLNTLDKDSDSFKKVIVSSQKGFETIELEDIVSIESRPGNYAIFSLEDGSQTMATKALNYYEDLFNKTSLFRIHRSSIVNLSHVRGFDGLTGKVLLSNGESLEVAHRRKTAFNLIFRQLYPV